MALYRISWRVRKSGYSGHGDYCLDEKCAMDWIVELNKLYPEINHWMEIESTNP